MLQLQQSLTVTISLLEHNLEPPSNNNLNSYPIVRKVLFLPLILNSMPIIILNYIHSHSTNFVFSKTELNIHHIRTFSCMLLHKLMESHGNN